MMKERTRTVSIVTLVLLAVVMFGLVSTAGTARASVLTISEDFQDNDAWQATVDTEGGNWTSYWYQNRPTITLPVADWPTSNPGDPAKGVQLRRGSSSTYSAVHVMYTGAGYTAAAGANDTGYFDDVSGSVIMQTGNSSTGQSMVLVRTIKPDYKTGSPAQGYLIGVFNNSSATNANLGIYKDPVSHTSLGTNLASSSCGRSLVARKLVFSAIGNTLSAWLYEWDDLAQDFTSLVATVSVTDSTYAEGLVGLRGGSGTNYQGGTFACLSFDAVPEPATMGLLAVGSLGVLLRRKHR